MTGPFPRHKDTLLAELAEELGVSISVLRRMDRQTAMRDLEAALIARGATLPSVLLRTDEAGVLRQMIDTLPAAESGGAPEWVLENAVIDIDLLGGTPQGRAWVADEASLSDLLGADANTSNWWGGPSGYHANQFSVGDGYKTSGAGTENEPLAAIGALRTALLAGCTMRIVTKDVEGLSGSSPLNIVSASGSAGIGFNYNDDLTVLIFSAGDIAQYSPGVLTLPGTNIVAATLTQTRFELSVNGSEPISASVDSGDWPTSGEHPLVAAMLWVTGSGFFQRITIYDALPDTTGLSALSAA